MVSKDSKIKAAMKQKTNYQHEVACLELAKHNGKWYGKFTIRFWEGEGRFYGIKGEWLWIKATNKQEAIERGQAFMERRLARWGVFDPIVNSPNRN